MWAKHNDIQRPFFLKSFTTTGSPNDFMISELQNISSSLCFIPWRNSGSKKGAMDDKSVQCGMIFPRNLMQVCAHKWASNLAPYIDSQIRQLRKQRLRGEAWVTCEVTYNRVKQKKTKRMMDEEGMIFSSVCPRRSDYFSFLDKLREVEVWSDTSHYSFVRNITGCSSKFGRQVGWRKFTSSLWKLGIEGR